MKENLNSKSISTEISLTPFKFIICVITTKILKKQESEYNLKVKTIFYEIFYKLLNDFSNENSYNTLMESINTITTNSKYEECN